MNVLILGSGGREHALSWKIAQSPKLDKLYIAPGNAGTCNEGTNINLKPTDFEGIKTFVLSSNIDMVVVGPEDPLVNGIHDYFAEDEALNHIGIVGPKAEGAQLEGSKEFAKRFMIKHGIPTAAYQSFTVDAIREGHTFLETLNPPYVLKADGLAAGKGVVILNDLEAAKVELTDMLESEKFGEASAKVVIEEFLDGIELSVFALSDGINYKILPSAKDYKRIGEGDTGLNTGGMGAVSPVPFADADFILKVEEQVIRPTFEGLKEDGIEYSGLLYFGLINVGGEPVVIEYNIRFGDPEAEAVIPRIETDLLDLFEAVCDKRLSELDLTIDSSATATVMLVSQGYPGSYEKGKEINGLGDAGESIAFHAGTKLVEDKIITNGGRVIAVTSFGENIEQALETSYANAERIKFEGKNLRRDIGYDLKVGIQAE
ncbi:MAG TPA: phosphoribosylamine--glycine ligase [Flavobacteriales bacterium]|nr:phosphoribosylamine--glycine ligase [Flavobacteriales bacterium]HIA10830.1 phosphoribosylamine--glycine ligase [Flavobacteriales bacterium]